MTHSMITSLATICVLCGIAACSRTVAPGGTDASATAGNQVVAAQPGSACDRKLIAIQDVASLFNQPVVETKNIPGDAQSCEFLTAGFSSVTISVRPGHGMAVLGMYTSGKMGEYEKSAPLIGVGDSAVRSLQLNRIVARKGDLLCEVSGPGNARGADDPAIHTLGALCNQIFAAY